MAAPIGSQVTLMKVDRTALLDEAKAMGIPERDAGAILDELADAMRTAIDAVDPALTRGWPSDRVAEIIKTRLERIDSGLPLGVAKRGGIRGANTLDEETLRR